MNPSNVSSNVAVLYEVNLPMAAEVEVRSDGSVSPNHSTEQHMEFGMHFIFIILFLGCNINYYL